MTHDIHPPGPAARPSARPPRAAALLSACALLAATSAALAADPKPSPGRSLADRQGCMGCHAIEAKLVGPSYQAVAERYRDQPGAEAELVQYIRSGSTGRWGPMAMPPQAQVSEADVRRLAKWILASAK